MMLGGGGGVSAARMRSISAVKEYVWGASSNDLCQKNTDAMPASATAGNDIASQRGNLIGALILV